MKKTLLPLLLCILLVTAAFGGWGYQQTLDTGRGPHGCVVDHDGKIWVTHYYPSGDTIFTTDGDTIRTNAVHVWIPTGDGYEQASFSPIQILTDGDAINDTLDYDSKPFSFRGASILPTGEILVMNKWIWKLDPDNGAALERFQPAGNASLTNPGVDANGYVYFGHVGASSGPVYILAGDDFSEKYGDAIAAPTWSLSRSMLASPDGLDLYIGTLSPSGILHFHSDLGPDGAYTLADTIESTKGWDVNGGMAWDRDGKMWVGGRSNAVHKQIVILDPENNFAVTEVFKDTLIFPTGVNSDTLTQGSGFGFSLTGDTVYVADYDGNCTKVFTKSGEGVWEHTETLVKGYALDQNYPNPFNPTTVIPFEIRESGFVQVLVYNMLGKEVANLVNKKLSAGKHTINFNGSSLPTGTYIYRLKANGVVKTRMMSLVK